MLQDEPVNDIGDGATAPDAQRVSGKGQVQVRAERSGALQNGRVYIVGFTATDDDGPCSGTATVCVPHDQSKKKPRCVDDGVRYDSFTGAQVS